MNFTNKEVKRAIRDFELKAKNIINANHIIYQTRVDEFINLIKVNKVIDLIVSPYFEIKIDFKKIQGNRGEDWFRLALPKEEDLQIAYILQIMKLSTEGELCIDKYTNCIFHGQSNYLSKWNQQILYPCLELILNKLQDLVEDEIEGKQKVPESVLNIINYGKINANKSNICGQSITQTIETKGISKKIVEKALEEKIISKQEVKKLEEITNKIEKELTKKTPSKSFLQSLVSKLYGIGQKALLTIACNIITDPIWSEEVKEFFIKMIEK